VEAPGSARPNSLPVDQHLDQAAPGALEAIPGNALALVEGISAATPFD